MRQQVARDDVADLLELDAGAEQVLAAARLVRRHLGLGDAGEIELDGGVAPVDLVVEGGKRIDLRLVRRFVELDDAGEHHLDRLAHPAPPRA